MGIIGKFYYELFITDQMIVKTECFGLFLRYFVVSTPAFRGFFSLTMPSLWS